MTEEDKNLLIQDLCARLPYGVKVQDEIGRINKLVIGNADLVRLYYNDFSIYSEKQLSLPCLFPLSSMTEEQIEEAKTYFWKDVDYGKSLVDKGINCFYPCFNILEFYHKYHLDYRGLIPKGLAIDATGLNIY